MPQVTHIAGRRIKFAAEAETVGVVVPCSDAEAVERVSALYRTKHIVLLALACCPSQPRTSGFPRAGLNARWAEFLCIDC